MLALIVALTLGQYPQHRAFMHPTLPRASYAFLEVAPSSGAGMTAACACTAITGAKGETITHTRASSATCSKVGAATTGIANGDLVTCATNEMRVEPDANGVKGLRVGGSRTNLAVRSDEFDNATWNKGHVTVGLPTVTADYATGPFGGTTADRVQVNACPTANNDAALVFQNYTGTAVQYTGSIYARGTSASASFSLYLFDSTANAGTAVTCNVVSTSWTRCQVPHTFANTTHRLAFGCVNYPATITGSSNTGAADFLVASAQSELGPIATPPIATVAASATRAADVFTAPYVASQSSGCLAATVSAVTSLGTSQTVLMSREASGSGDFLWLYATTDNRMQVSGSSASTSNGGTLPTAGQRFVGRWNGSAGAVLGYVAGAEVFTTSSLSIAMDPATIVGIGQSAGSGNEFEGIISRVQVDPDSSRCSAL